MPFGNFHPGQGKIVWLRVLYVLLNRAINTSFRYASTDNRLKLAAHIDSLGRSAKSTPSPKPVLRQAFGLRLLVGTRFQVYFTVLSGLLFTFPSRYLFTIGHKVYLAFPGSTGCFPQYFRVLGYSRLKTESSFAFAYRTITSYGSPFQGDSASK